MKKTIDNVRNKQLDHDLIAIGIITFIALSLIIAIFGKQFNGFVYDTSRSVLPRVAMGSSAGYRLRLGAIVVLGMRTLALLPALAMARTVCAASSRLGREMSSE